ncbi:MAG TPA: hypothetical protein VIY27_05105 [Myxococcota bacterium]
MSDDTLTDEQIDAIAEAVCDFYEAGDMSTNALDKLSENITQIESVQHAVSPENIRELASDAAEAGDRAMVAICRLALEGDADAIWECARVLAETRARAQND